MSIYDLAASLTIADPQEAEEVYNHFTVVLVGLGLLLKLAELKKTEHYIIDLDATSKAALFIAGLAQDFQSKEAVRLH